MKAVLSCTNQTYKNLEIIIINDGSTDDTRETVNALVKRYKNIIYHENSTSRGSNYSRNLGIRLSKGEYLTGLDDDDEFLPNRIEDFVKNHNAKYAFLCSRFLVRRNTHRFVGGKGGQLSLDQVKFNNYVGNQVFTFRSRYLAVGGFDNELMACQDYDLWLRMMYKYGNALQLKTPSIVVNELPSQRITTGGTAFSGYYQFYSKHKASFTRTQRARKLLRVYEIRRKKMTPRTWITFFLNGLFLSSIKFAFRSWNETGIRREAQSQF